MMHVRLVATFCCLLVLLIGTYLASRVDLGLGNFWISIAFAVAKTALILAFFMRAGSAPLARAFVLVAASFLVVMYWLTANDDLVSWPPSASSNAAVADRGMHLASRLP